MQTALLVSCDDPGAVDAALVSGADALIFDLAGPSATRPARRQAALAGLYGAATSEVTFGCIVRLAASNSGDIEGDLDAVMRGAPDAVLLARTEGPASVERLGAKLAVREAERGLPIGSTRIIASPAETGAGLLLLPRLAEARSRLAALLWNAAALAADLGATDPDCQPCRVARTAVLAAAAACGVPAFEAVLRDDDDDVLRQCDAARRDGFTGLLLNRSDHLQHVRDGGGVSAASRVDYAGPQL